MFCGLLDITGRDAGGAVILGGATLPLAVLGVVIRAELMAGVAVFAVPAVRLFLLQNSLSSRICFASRSFLAFATRSSKACRSCVTIHLNRSVSTWCFWRSASHLGLSSEEPSFDGGAMLT
jgi:hypothetical protein